MTKYYAVRRGFKTGIFNNWGDTQEQTNGFSGAQFQSFYDYDEALAYLKEQELVTTPRTTKVATDVFAFVDGSYNKSTNEVGSAVILRSGNRQIQAENIGFKNNNRSFDNMRNVAGEILAAQHAVERALALHMSSITIFYDYQGIENWVKGNWRANKSSVIKYVNTMARYSDSIQIEFVKVAAHTGIALNEKADQTAKHAVGIFD